MTIEQKAAMRDDLIWWMEVSMWFENDPDQWKEAKESMLNYLLGMYASINPNIVFEDWDTDFVDREWKEYRNQTRWILCPIQDFSFMYWYNAGRKNLNKPLHSEL